MFLDKAFSKNISLPFIYGICSSIIWVCIRTTLLRKQAELRIRVQSKITKFITLNKFLFPAVNATRFFQISSSKCCLMFLLEEASLNNVKAFFADVINTAPLLINHHAHFRGVTSYLGVREFLKLVWRLSCFLFFSGNFAVILNFLLNSFRGYFRYYLAAPRPTWGYHQGDSPIQTMLITARASWRGWIRKPGQPST